MPGLPDITKSVYLSPGSTVCDSLGAIANPNKDVLIQIGACAISSKRIRVNIKLPTAPEAYLSAHMQRSVEIVWKKEAQSDANIYTAWTAIRNLEN